MVLRMAHSKIRIAGHSHGIRSVLVEDVSFNGPIDVAVTDLIEVLYQYALKAERNPVIKLEHGGVGTVIRVSNYDAFAVSAY